MPLLKSPHITRRYVQANPSTIFVFGDNLQQHGFGGQAREMRGEPNTVGIPTKHKPNNLEDSFFKDADFDQVRPHIDQAFAKLEAFAKVGHTIVIPANGIGTGLADLPRMAPQIHDYIQTKMIELERLCN